MLFLLLYYYKNVKNNQFFIILNKIFVFYLNKLKIINKILKILTFIDE